jgi:hypothetical protein
MTKYQFRIIGVPPEEALKEIDIPEDATVKDVKLLIADELGIDPDIVDLNLIWNKAKRGKE